jgi:hypothetical protein
MKPAASLCVSLALVLLAGCTNVPTGSARLSKGEAVRIATALAQHEGAEMEHFTAPRVHFVELLARFPAIIELAKTSNVNCGDVTRMVHI